MNEVTGAPGTSRPGGRTARVREAVLRAAGDAFADKGIGGVDLGEVARRAGVGKTTVYRRWGTVPGLVADMLAEMAESSLPRARTGDLDADLAALASLILATLTDARQGPLFKAVIAAAASDAQTAAALHRFYRVRIDEWSPCVDEAVARGDLPAGTDADEVIRALSAPLYYRFLVSGDPLDEAAAARAAAATAAAARAGAYT
ncbi:TetR/AcrR family transcriptional regulator [Glycomyces terrestris]|uniref:TetR/AcrR family transcriptional regulator n=1 Tax=Glycomyces terrestris TaxID=2493553 RepID=A0A426UUZ7_9ACTN|nr:TetR/AcrR family transcriptional regulator [Glycomyces terrestris]RRR98166.1 TetR/AcrR family transcriptional regulator [Glycomyces terrestris]